MCGRFTLHMTWAQIHEHLCGFVSAIKQEAIPQIEHAPARFNIAPTQPVLVFRREGGEVEPALMRWGLVPEWVEDPNDFPLIINARAETLAEKTSFKHGLKNRRCIIPATGYYEWRKNEDGSKTPFYISRKDKKPLLMAALFSTWVGPDGEEVDTTAIITVAASDEILPVHRRSPAILEGEAVKNWLDTAKVNAPGALDLLHEIPKGTCRYHSVSTRVNSVRNDDETLILPAYEKQEDGATDTSAGSLEKVSPRKKQTPKKPRQLDLF